MPIKVLVVDDSGFFRRRIVEILDADPSLSVVGTASDGREAILKAGELKPDVITMDVAMPVMDGIAAVRAIMRDNPTKIIMFSALTTEGARATLDALDAGAVDFLAKQEGLAVERTAFNGCALCERIVQIAKGSTPSPLRTRQSAAFSRRTLSTQSRTRDSPGCCATSAAWRRRWNSPPSGP